MGVWNCFDSCAKGNTYQLAVKQTVDNSTQYINDESSREIRTYIPTHKESKVG